MHALTKLTDRIKKAFDCISNQQILKDKRQLSERSKNGRTHSWRVASSAAPLLMLNRQGHGREFIYHGTKDGGQMPPQAFEPYRTLFLGRFSCLAFADGKTHMYPHAQLEVYKSTPLWSILI